MNAAQLSLSRLAGLRPVDLCVLRTYSDRDAGTVHRTYFFSDRFVEYPYGGTPTQFLPLIRSHRGPDFALMSHVQDDGAKLGRRLQLTLANLPLPSGVQLATDLRTTNLRRATLELAQVLLPSTGGDLDLTGFAGTEHSVVFRGEVTAPRRIDADTIELDFETVEPRVPWRYALLPGTDPLDFGARFPLPYGRAKRVKLVGLDVGGFTTIAGATTTTATTLLVTDTERLSTSGIGYIGGERITWTGKTATSLTGVTRGSSGTVPLEHAPGATLLEIKDSTFVVAGFRVSAIGEVYVRQYNGELVRVVGQVTKNVADTTAPGHSGVELATVRLPVAQFESIVQQLETAVAVAQQPAVSGGTVAGVNILTLDGDNVTTGGSAQSAVPPTGFLNVGWRAPRNFPFEAIVLGPVVGTSKAFQFPAPPGGSAGISQTITVRAYNTGGSDAVFRIESSGSTAISADFTIPANTLPSAPVSFSFDPPGAVDGNSTLGVFNGKVRHVSGSTLNGFELERTMTVIQTVAVDATSIQIGGTDQTKAKIGATSSRGTGYRLELFADVNGPTAPDGNYSVAQGVLLEAMPDCIRHFVSAFCGLGSAAIEASSFSAAIDATRPNAHAFDVRDFGTGFDQILARAAWEARLNVTRVERASATQYALHAANRQYRFGGPVEVVDGFATIEERPRSPDDVVTRIRALYLRDQSRGGAQDRDAYAGATSFDKNSSPVSKPSATDLDAAEDRWGRNDSRTLLLASIRDPATLLDVVGWFAWEWIRDSRQWIVRGVPYTVAYRLEPGDVVELRGIPWAPGEEWHARVLGVEWNPDTGMRDLSLIELSPSTAVALLVGRATITPAAVVQSTVLAVATLNARATMTPAATQSNVIVTAALVGRATIVAPLSGGTSLAAAALVGTAAITVGTNLDGDSGEILGQTQETVAGEPQSLAQHHSLEFQSNESLTAAAATIGVANSWSLALWLRLEALSLTGNTTNIEITSNAGTTNRISFGVRGAVANDPIRVELNDSAGVLFKSYTWDSLVTINLWQHFVVTWDGTTLRFYLNGEEVSPTATPTNNAGTMTDTSREVIVGSTEPGAEFADMSAHSVALWSAVLTANAVRQVFNQGDGASMNLLVDDDDYVSAAALQHWWRIGHNVSALGADSGVGTAITLS